MCVVCVCCSICICLLIYPYTPACVQTCMYARKRTLHVIRHGSLPHVHSLHSLLKLRRLLLHADYLVGLPSVLWMACLQQTAKQQTKETTQLQKPWPLQTKTRMDTNYACITCAYLSG